jgi:hypothetical protein
MNDDQADQLSGLLKRYGEVKKQLRDIELIKDAKLLFVRIREDNTVTITGKLRNGNDGDIPLEDEQARNFLKGVIKSLLDQQQRNLEKERDLI